MDRRIAEALENGTLTRPSDSERPDLVHLVRTLAVLCGCTAFDRPPAVQGLLSLIQPADHIIFILLDGMGMNIVRRLPASSFLASHVRAQILAISPSTTACALTSVATAQWPAQHGVTGWFTHLPKYGITAMILPFSERVSHQSLTLRGLTAESVLPLRAFYPLIPRRQLTLMPEQILNTVYAVYSRGATPGAGYKSIANAVDQMIEFVQSAREPTYTHFYVPDVDSLVHKRGVGHPSVLELVTRIDAELARLASAVAGKARIVISADHGLIDVAPANHSPIFDGDPLLEMLKAPPSGDARLPLFHVRRDRREAFLDAFRTRFSQSFELMEIDEVERLGFFGPYPMSPVSKRRFGDYVGIALRSATLLYHPPQPPTQTTREPYLAQHGGLSNDEMRIPLIVA